ncbi:Acetate kinase [Fimicolochytrium jonesii]|uniref:Acetate kinase n=1 Tax=Fimicolochytrium jonesii TaxID=1396493 RepID=UPI0022FE4711|nr:Acetate kinase [Fimicolochytrium jonesii]KAI8817644.1 Acetate kinase [Fimicolochytrium jonesii]
MVAHDGTFRILVVNAGSSTVKFRLYEQTGSDRKLLAKGSGAKIGSSKSTVKIEVQEDAKAERKADTHENTISADEGTTHDSVFRKIIQSLAKTSGLLDHVKVVGHRVVHGGAKFSDPVVLTHETVSALDELSDLAPLHNHPSVMLIRTALNVADLKAAKQVAVFDTQFHKTLEEKVWRYPLPYDACNESGLRKYGFHGISYSYVSRAAAKHLGKPLEQLKLIILHLGNGASACAIKHGKSIDTSMGFTPLEGLMMGTRSGDIDPSAPYHVSSDAFSVTEKTPAVPAAPDGPKITKVEDVLNHKSGLIGICGESDMGKIVSLAQGKVLSKDDGDEEAKRRAQLAVDMFCYRVQKYIGAYFVACGGADSLVFTGGIGEKSAYVRSQICHGLECLGLRIDEAQNEKCVVDQDKVVEIGEEGSRLRAIVVATDEEGEIARLAADL